VDVGAVYSAIVCLCKCAFHGWGPFLYRFRPLACQSILPLLPRGREATSWEGYHLGETLDTREHPMMLPPLHPAEWTLLASHCIVGKAVQGSVLTYNRAVCGAHEKPHAIEVEQDPVPNLIPHVHVHAKCPTLRGSNRSTVVFGGTRCGLRSVGV